MPVSTRISLSPTPDIFSAIRALVKFDISANTLNAEGCEAIAKALKDNDALTELNIAKNDMTWNTSKGAWGEKSAVSAIADAIPTMGALTSLDISDNHIPNDQQANLKRICERKNIDLQL